MTMVQRGFPSDELRDEHGRGLPHAFDRLERALRPEGGERMAKSVLDMSMSLDGFITGPDDGPGNGLGTGGNRLHEWLGEPVSGPPYFDPPGLSGQVFAELMATGAVVVGRKTFDYAGQWGGDHHGVPIFIPTRGVLPATQSGWVHYVHDAATAVREAKAAAGDKDVMVHGASLAQSLLREGLLDEMEIHLIPVVLGAGRRLFGADRIELELTRVLDAPGVTHLRYRVPSSATVR
jgi:dihydrofolate reductase